MPLSSTMEDYLETIYILQYIEKKEPSVTEIARRLSVKKPTVTYALNNLKEARLIYYKPYGPIVLTPKGKKDGAEIYKRHKLLVEFLEDFLGISEKISDADACKIEHVLSQITLQRLTQFIDFMKKECPQYLSKFNQDRNI